MAVGAADGLVEWALRRSGYLAADDHLESVLTGRLRSMTIEGAPAQLQLRGLPAFVSHVPVLRTTWSLHRAPGRLFLGAGFGLLLPIDLSFLWRVSIDDDSNITLVYSGSGLTALRFEKVRRDPTATSVWGPEWVAEVVAARDEVYAAMSLEERAWAELWRTELEESGALDRIESSLVDHEDLRAPRDGIDNKAWHRLLAAVGAIGRDDSHGLALTLKWVVEAKTSEGAIASAYAQHLLGEALTARINGEVTREALDTLAHAAYDRWSTLLSLVSPYDVSVLRSALGLACGVPFEPAALDGRRAQAVITALGVLLDDPVSDLVASRPALAAWSKRAKLHAKTVESLASSSADEVDSGADLASNWATLRWAVLAGAYGDTTQFLSRLAEHDKAFVEHGPARALLFFAVREEVFRRLEGRGSRTDLALLAAEAGPKYSKLLNKMEVADLEEVLERVFQFREANDRMRGASFTIRAAGALAVMLANPVDDLDGITQRVLEQAAGMIESAK